MLENGRPVSGVLGGDPPMSCIISCISDGVVFVSHARYCLAFAFEFRGGQGEEEGERDEILGPAVYPSSFVVLVVGFPSLLE